MMARVLDRDAVLALARELAAELPQRSVVWLEGPLGAGKTTLAREFVAARGGGADATSPSYGLVHRHPCSKGGGEIWHLDCYRLRTADEAADLDWEEAAAADVLLIEWPERAGAYAPPADIIVKLEHHGDDSRLVEVIR